MSDPPGAWQWDEGWKGPIIEYTRFRTRVPSGLKLSVLPLDQAQLAHREGRAFEIVAPVDSAIKENDKNPFWKVKKQYVS